MRQRHGDRGAEREPRADTAGEAGHPQHAPDREASHRDDEPRPHEAKLPVEPEAAELELSSARRPVSAPTGVPTRIAARDGRAVERRVEALLVYLEPAAKRLSGATAPGAPLGALDHPRCLAHDHGDLPCSAFEDRQRLELVPGLSAGAADAVVPLKRGERPVAGASPGNPGSLPLGLLAIHRCEELALVHPGTAFDVQRLRLVVELLLRLPGRAAVVRAQAAAATRRDVAGRAPRGGARLAGAGSLLVHRSRGDLLGAAGGDAA